MNKFTGLGDDFLATLTEKTEKLRKEETTDLGKPQNLPDMINLALYKPVIYCGEQIRADEYRDKNPY